VSVRVRPLNDAEAEKGSSWRVEGNKISQLGPGGRDVGPESLYNFDNVFDEYWTTQQVINRPKTCEELNRAISMELCAYGIGTLHFH
jgi:hypothetical protein